MTARSAWRFFESGPRSGAYNMALDEAAARRMQDGTGEPLLRLYRWTPWAISLGHHQSTADIDLSRCRADGIDVVRRPTGGRAILHAEELTYAVVMPAGRKSILQVYNEISEALVCGLRDFGVEVALQRSQPNFTEAYRHASSIPCFTSSARYEIEWNGRKLVGSAQRRFGEGEIDTVLQHGSILCGNAHRRLAGYLALEDADILQRIRAEMEAKTTDLREITGTEVDLPRLARAIRRGFESAWGITFRESVPEEITAAMAEPNA
jgi:lipoyl(octanoyl) transferase